ncbi:MULTISPECIES: helix-turn-helix domain-containing protein [Thermoactinomyces]|uniref:Helix-turn-helix domain-containing protein n=2 Tax=Thermoactinomyces daqus TaxID=1329516 RepID=A0A7W1XDL2_9BACL|nr:MULTISPECIES: helix-turn-helix domain-containing protein [Thermoactinomyces]MBA4544727.1 helix-turn-helix domain-containing protein [Thermoactinomyces daqus]MBH8599163.1 helix-turn-helix domain-containing protein [Thermoactinomyces sp. CICC 10523]MBH8605413.1 helix-turn-helix domain-containing protein [Thermoactinomyces sp. CICC 10522]MBH8609451.1 helix-turn-helix domain-containing protein [Thermoactinomyces sp. CICC 10521]
MIKQMQQKGMTISQIAKELGRDRKTIRKWLNEEKPSKYQRVQANWNPTKDTSLSGCRKAGKTQWSCLTRSRVKDIPVA